MHYKYSLILLTFLCFTSVGFSQEIASFSSVNSIGCSGVIYNDANTSANGICRGPGISQAAGGTYNSDGWPSFFIDNDDYLEWSITPDIGFEINLSSIDLRYDRSSTGPAILQLHINTGSGFTNIYTDSSVSTSGENLNLDLSSFSNLNNTITFRIYANNASSSGGTFDIEEHPTFGLNKGIIINGTVNSINTDQVDWCNLQWPNSGSVSPCDDFVVYAQTFEAGVTDAAGQGSGIDAWIGYSTTNSDPSVPANAGDWTWISATYNTSCSDCNGGQNDEYYANLGANVSSGGPYYYLSRFQYNSGPFTYGGYNAGGGGFWDGSTNVSGTLTITNEQVDFCNVDYPKTATITLGDSFDVYAQVYEPGITDSPGQGANIQAWIGYNEDDVDPFSGIGWTWVAATYDSDWGNNDQYVANIGSLISAPGSYYFASRFQIGCNDYSYGGIFDDNIGNFWDATNDNGILIVQNAPCSDLIISEYVEGSSFNKCIELYNPTGSTIDLSNYSLELYANGNTTPNGSGLTLSGSIASGGTYVICNPSASASVLSLSDSTSGYITFNGNDAVVLLHSATIIDVIGQIGYDPGTEWSNGSVSTLNRTLRRDHTVEVGDPDGNDVFNPGDEWSVFPIDNISDLGFHFNDCIPSNELQLQLPVGINVSCGYSFDFPTTTLNTTSDVVLRIQNLGSLPLEITNLSFLNGINYSLVGSPPLPFSIPASSYQDITIRFLPTTLGLLSDTLTIYSDDASESSCSIDLSGIGESNCATTTETLFAQDFESSANDTWSYTANHDGTSFPNNWGINTSLANPFSPFNTISGGQSGTHFWGITDLERSVDSHENQQHQLVFTASGLNSYSNVQLSFYYYTIGVDYSDSLEYELIYDSVSQGISDISADNDAWTQVLINIPSSVNSLTLIFYADLDAQSDLAGLDTIELTSTTINTATWDGSSWDNVVGPDTSMVGILNGNYDTSSEGSFSACNLFVNSGILTIADNTFVEVENDVIVDSNIIVNPYGSFVQNNDLGTVTVANQNSITVEKLTAEANQWYEYTYWGSPVANETIENGLAESSTNRRFAFNGANYLDSLDEIGNSGNYNSGQDDIDDDANDWYYVSGATVMQPGVGYASTLNSTIFNSTPGCPGCQIKFTFNGAFNNGIITVPVYRNDSELSDNNWNFISNPYPSAIDADLFLAVNTAIDDNVGASSGAIFFWSQHTPPSNGNSGNENVNFPQSDYAIINASGETVGGDNVKPDRFIPSCQGFFIAYDDASTPDSVSGDIATGYITFNNAMRVTGNNDLFFRGATTTMSDNKVWLNLTSDTGVFNQLLVAYVNGASNDDDGMYYDAPRNMSTGSVASFYSLIGNSEKKFAIQGKAPESLTENEVIPLGFTTIIDVPTIYTISVSQIQGEFLMNHTVYIHDKIMNLFHDLNESDYTFTSEVGEFNDRFEIVFQTTTLSTEDQILSPNDLTIVELQDSSVKFKVSKNHTISQVEIIDLLGRTLYTLKGNGSEEIYFLPQLSQSAYLAKVTLGNGQTLSKKTIKKN